MKVIDNELVLCVDVDGTLILPPVDAATDTIKILCPYDGKYYRRSIHKPHIKALRNYVARGAHVMVWSRNGARWAAAVLEALGLDHLDVYVKSKPFAYMDDLPCQEWMGEHMYIKPTDNFGSDGE